MLWMGQVVLMLQRCVAPTVLRRGALRPGRCPPPAPACPQAVDYARKRLKQGIAVKDICEQMCDACLAPDLKGLCR